MRAVQQTRAQVVRPFNSLKSFDRLMDAGVSEQQAREFIGIFEDSINASVENLTTKPELEAAVVSLKSEIQTVETTLKSEIQSLRSDMQASEASLRSEIQASEASVRADMQALEISLKSEIKALRSDMQTSEALIRADMQASDALIRADMQTLETSLKAEIKSEVAAAKAELKQDISEQGKRLSALESGQIFLQRLFFGGTLTILLSIGALFLHQG